MKKIKTLLCLFGAIITLSSCGSNNNQKDEKEPTKIEVLGNPDISTAYWEWQKNEANGYDVTLYLTYFANEKDTEGTEVPIDVEPVRTTLSSNTCTEDGLDRYIATFVANGVTIQSYKDVITPKKGHNFTNYYDDGETHCLMCECGLIDRNNKIPHTYLDDGNYKTETCKYCNHKHFTDEYLKNKITNLKAIISSLHVPTDIEDAINNWNLNSLANTVIDALEPEDAKEFTNEEISKLISVAYTYRTFLDASKYNSFNVDSLIVEPYIINNSYENDNEYGSLRTFNLPTTIPQRMMSMTPEDPVLHPASGIQVDYQATVYNTVEIPYFPQISAISREIGFKFYVPTEGIEYRLLGYYSFPNSLAKTYNYLTNDVMLNQGWNTITFSDFSVFSNITHIFIEIKDSQGSMPAGDYKLTSIISRCDDASKLPSEISAMPSAQDIEFTYYEKILNSYNLYQSLDDKIKTFITGSDKLVECFNVINNKYSLPFGSSIYLTNSSQLNDPMPYKNINGNSMYGISTSASSVFSGLIKAQDPLPCPHETLGFLSYQEGTDAFGGNPNTQFKLLDNMWGEYLTLTTVQIRENWYLHYVPLDKIDECLTKAAKTIYGASYIRLRLSGIPVSSVNQNSLYISTLYSFDTSLI